MTHKSRNKKRHQKKNSQATQGASPPKVVGAAATQAQVVELFVANPQLIQQARTLWQLGEWQELESLSAQPLESFQERAELVLLVAAAALQLGLPTSAKGYIEQARRWGASPASITQVLISGAYNSLGKAAAASGHVDTAQQHLQQAAQLSTPNGSPSLIRTRLQNQLQQSPDALAALAAKRLTIMPTPQALGLRKQAAAEPLADLLSQHYSQDLETGVWAVEAAQSIDYSDGDEVEERIFAAVKQADDLSLYSKELLAHQIDWPSIYHLSPDRVNLLRPFAAHLAGLRILELGCGCGAITRYLGELGAEVVAVEGSFRRASIAARRCHDLPNVQVVCDKAQAFPLEQHFDVVTFIGVLEYAQLYVDATAPVDYLLRRARRYLKKDGMLFVAIENQLGLKYFSGAPEDHGVGVMAGIQDLYTEQTPITFGRVELKQRLTASGFAKVDTFLPFPDYKLPTLLVHPSHQALAAEEWNFGDLLAQTATYDQQKIKQPFFLQELTWPLLARNGLVADLANSHLFVAHQRAEEQLTDPCILASYYSPKRTAKYSQEIQFVATDTEVQVRRRNIADTAATRLSQHWHTEPLIKGRLHSLQLVNITQHQGWGLQDLVDWAAIWINVLVSQQLVQPDLKNVPVQHRHYATWLPANFLDAAPRNLVVSPQGQTSFIDLEWTADHPLPLELVVYRGLEVTFAQLPSAQQPTAEVPLNLQALIVTLMQRLGFTLSEQDYSFFMPILDRLTRIAQGHPENPEPPTKPSEKTNLNVSNNVLTNASETFLTLYWSTAECGFHEDHTVKKLIALDTRKQQLRLQLPKIDHDFLGFRLDPTGCKACVLLANLQLCNEQGEVLWRWSHTTAEFYGIGELHITNILPNALSSFLCVGSDSQFRIKLPETIPMQPDQLGYFELEFIAYPYE